MHVKSVPAVQFICKYKVTLKRQIKHPAFIYKYSGFLALQFVNFVNGGIIMEHKSKKQLAIGCDHAGYELKEELLKFLRDEGYELKDFGTWSKDSVDYPDFVHPLADYIESGQAEAGILICGSGNGVCMAANKHQGIRAALCWAPELAALARQHNNANVICIPARFVSNEMAHIMANIFLKTEFEGGRHQNRVDKIKLPVQSL